MSGQSANDEERRRKQEMSMFAAYATGGDDTNGGGDKGFDGSSLRFDKPPAVATNKQKEPQRSANDNSFLAAARAGAAGTFQDSGSFAFQSPTATTTASNSNDTHRSSSRVSVAERSNLSAALAALTKDDPSANSATTSKSSSAIKLPAVGGTAPTHFRSSGGGTDANHDNNGAAEDAAAMEDKIPMFAEEVVMPRPLFFGAIVPPRVLQAAREMVQTAVQEQKALASAGNGAGAVPLDKPPRLHELPPAVRNIVGALRTYGFGLDELLSKPPPVDRRFSNHSSTSSTSKRASFEEPEDWWRGSGHVTTYQPVWGSDVRAARVQEYLAHHAAVKKPSIVSRVSTAPPRMVGGSSDEEEDDDDYGDDDDDSFVAAPPVAAIPEHDIVFVDKGGGGGDEKPPVVNANDQFSSWIRQDSDSLPGNASAGSVSSMRSGDSLVGGAVEESAPAELSEQEKFSQWALGSTGDLNGTTIVAESPVFHTGNGSDTFQFSSPFNPSTFQRMRTSSNVDSDDGSIFDDEQKKQVGVNESLSKAVALLAEDDGPAQANVDPAAEQSQILLSQVPQDGKRKRPLTNYELTSGCVPLFGVDDSPLPQEADLGILETKEEVQRATEQKRSQEIIEKFVPRNVFGPIVCPNPATNPDDYHSWNSRTTSSSNPMNMGRVTSASSVASDPVGLRRQHYNTAGSDPMGRVNSNTSPQKPPKIPRQGRDVSGLPPSKPPLQGSRQRFGWWSQSPKTPENDKQQSLAKDGIPEELEAENDALSSTQDLQFPPSHHSASAVQFVTPLEPNPEELREDNLPLSRMHAATSMVQSLPYLSDRPASFRYLQIDTQAIAFPPIKTEIEPLFCSLALYNVETVSSGMSTTGAKNSAPIPDLQRCGRVTEALYFDHVVDPEVEERCEGALWPYAKSNPTARDVSSDRDPSESERLRGTRCGVFPIPSNLNVSNLYAVLIVQKVVSENADLDPYLKPGKPINDLEKLKSNAAKNSARHGSFVVPFAFGVAPLLQVFGTDNPVTASSRAVQIPLFHFSDGERQIIDHIMVMLFPRADHRANGVGGPAPVTNGGTAMLVMRNFGYLGLHTVVDSKSSLARDRLVDFTGELQLRRRTIDDDDDELTPLKRPASQQESYQLKLPKWHPGYLAEPTVDGGRNAVESSSTSADAKSVSLSKLYAQELAPLPLMFAPTTRISPNSHTGKDDIEPFYHTSFCNELLCHPRILHNCPQGTVSIKVELREVEWNEGLNAYCAHEPNQRIGPSIHNSRRGPFLVQSAFTSCTPRRSDHQFMDEVKVKLPLDLNRIDAEGKTRSLCLFFTVYRIKRGSKSVWKRGAKMIFGTSSVSDPAGTSEETQMGRLEQVACGFLPLTAQTCLIDNGLHDVRVVYNARDPSPDMIEEGSLPPTSLILSERTILGDSSGAGRDDSFAEDTTTASNESLPDSRMKNPTNNEKMDSDSVSMNEDSITKSVKGGKVAKEPISLSVRVVVYSSLHAQNSALNDLLHQESDLPVMSYLPNKVFMATLRMGREYLASNAIFNPTKHSGHAREAAMIEPTIAITDHQVCTVPRSTDHLLRIMPLLWRSLICGDGEPNLIWANPGASTPLRVHSFATILHLVGATSLYMSKNGVTQVDGASKWNVVVLGRVLALMFDERHLFGDQAVEKFDTKYWLSLAERKTPAQKKSPPRRRGHVRTNYELGNDVGPPAQSSSVVSNIPSTAGDLVTLPKRVPPEKESLSAIFEIDIRGSDDSGDAPSPKPNVKVDTKSDFQSFLRAANTSLDEEDDIVKPEGGSWGKKSKGEGSAAANAFVQAFGGISASSNRRFMTAPAPTLPSIAEGIDDSSSSNLAYDAPDSPIRQRGAIPIQPSVNVLHDSTGDGDGDIFNTLTTRPTRKMRVPQLSRGGSLNLETEQKLKDRDAKADSATRSPKVPKSGEEMEKLGDAFLDTLGASLGMSLNIDAGGYNGEEKRVGSSHHRKRTQGRSSIDWTLIPGDERTLPEATTTTTTAILKEEYVSLEGGVDENDEHLSTLKSEESTFVKLPSFVDRLITIGDTSPNNARWFPYAYEVIILQWAAILMEQRKVGEKKSKSKAANERSAVLTARHNTVVNENLSHAALRSIGVAVAGAPMLFEVIKKSLGFRVKTLFNAVLSKNGSRMTPPLVSLDDTLMMHLVQVVSMVTDACIDSRNFDSWELRQMSIDVNDAIVRFLRDLFSFLSPACVHRLMLAYLSRFVTKEGKHSTDRDSLIGLRCSWEITKLRLNAVTALIRFPDFIKVNSPQMLNWSNWWTHSPSRSSGKFFDDILERYQLFRLPDFVSNEGGIRKDVLVASMRPHWLAEIAVDICLLGTEHAEQYIHQRSASLLNEMFWACSQESILYGISAPVGGMFTTYIEKLVSHASYLSNFAPKSQLRKDVLTSGIYVLQSAPTNLLRALWRKLCSRLPGKGLDRKYGIVVDRFGYDSGDENGDEAPNEGKDEPDILGMFSLLNLALRTIEYEGSDENLEVESSGDNRNNLELWRKEFLLSKSPLDGLRRYRFHEAPVNEDDGASSTSRKWQAHDGSMTIVDAAHQIVREMYTMLSMSPRGKVHLNPAVCRSKVTDHEGSDAAESGNGLALTRADTVLFIRAVASLYLHALSLRESDIVVSKTFLFSAEVIKIFGIKLFLEAVGETHQHWMRVISIHCGARRAAVRIEATDLLELVLRSTWECYGSFFRIRLPLLAVQTEVMERIVATAAARYYRDQRRLGTANFEAFTNVGAEASLVPLWRTLDRIQKQPASQNVAFRGALIRIAGKLKKLYRAYVAARVLSFIKNTRETPAIEPTREERNFEVEAIVRANRINILRVINASEGFSKQFLGFQGTTIQQSSVAHYEAVEDALIDAANVFSPTELPEHRVAWLRMLAEFHSSRKKFAEQATCHYHIHVTLHLAARLHGSLWSNTPFMPWTDNIPDPIVYIDGDPSPTVDPDYQESELNFDGEDFEYCGQVESAISFRRIFYRVANSITMGNNEFETGGSKNLFYGVTYLSEYCSVSPWISLREMEENMVEEVEEAGSLFLRAGIIESSRFSWSLATQYYADKFNYGRLTMAYGNLSRAIVSQVPSIDSTSLPQEVTAILGRFYRVWFHGGAPDELSGVEFVYRTQGSVRLKEFGEELRAVIQTIIPGKTPIHLILDGHTDERFDDTPASYSGFRIGPAPLEPVHIKVTPLRPRFDKDSRTRGLPEWFNTYVDEAFSGQTHRSSSNEFTETGKRIHRKEGSNLGTGTVGDGRDFGHSHSRSLSATIFSSTGSQTAPAIRKSVRQTVNDADRLSRYSSPQDSDLSGVDKFCFVQPKNRSRPKEWWKASAGDFAEKSLRVTQLQVAESFPACVSRQEVVHRLVYLQSPLEAGIDAVCQWCAVLFRTAVATVGMNVLRSNHDPGIGTDAAKVVADCIHSSHVKDIGLTLLKKHSEAEQDNATDFAFDSSHLDEDEIDKMQLKLARLILTFVELLHLLIARNRDKLLNVIQERKRNNSEGLGSIHGGSSHPSHVGSTAGGPAVRTRHISIGTDRDGSVSGRKSAYADVNRHKRFLSDTRSDGVRSEDPRAPRVPHHNAAGSDDNQSYHSMMTSTVGVRTDSAIAVQSELQRAFISLTKVLYKNVQGVMREETPRWLKQSGQDNYFSLGTYKQAVIPIAEELCFNANDPMDSESHNPFTRQHSQSLHSEQGYESPRGGSVEGGSQGSVVSRGSERYGFGQF